MKTSTIGLSLLALLLVSCGKDNKVSSVPNNGSNTDAFTTGVLAKNGTPKTKDSISFNQKRYLNNNTNRRCSYIIKTDVLVVKADSNNIRLRIKNKSTGGTTNSTYCPYTHPQMRTHQTQNVSVTQFINKTKVALNKGLNPNIFCSENKDWCTNYRLIQKKDITKYDIPSVFVEAEYHSKGGHIYNRKTYISKVSLLQNVYEYEMTNVRTREIVDFKRIKPKNTRRRPRR